MDVQPKTQQLEEEAATWLLKRESADWSDQDEVGLNAWLEASPDRQVAYICLRATWAKVGRLKAVSAEFKPGQIPARGEIKNLLFFQRNAGSADAPPGARNVLKKHRIAAAAAAIAIAVTAISLIAVSPAWFTRGTTVQTAIGGLSTVPMPDGSRVTLNTDSELRIVIDSKERRIDLARGEAYFDVARDPARPFIVSAAGKRITAVGTAFSVRIGEASVDVKVTEGRVRVDDKREARTLAHLDRGAVARLSMAAQDGVVIQQQSHDALEQSLAWRNGMIVLRGTPLPEAVAEFNRYNEHKLLIGDHTLADIKVGGNFKPNNVNGFVRLLRQGFQVEARTDGGNTVLRPAPSSSTTMTRSTASRPMACEKRPLCRWLSTSY